jgi:hypothetical protein
VLTHGRDDCYFPEYGLTRDVSRFFLGGGAKKEQKEKKKEAKRRERERRKKPCTPIIRHAPLKLEILRFLMALSNVYLPEDIRRAFYIFSCHIETSRFKHVLLTQPVNASKGD